MRDPLFRNDSSHRVAVMQYGQPVTGRELAHGESGRGDGLVIDTNLNQAFDPADTYFKLSNASVAALPGQSLRVVDTETGPARCPH
ncbi:MAG: hypothetical protein SFZ03_11975 [Candidatus Melainabacteria bacterium]|nr:hypothetical protein [Candidatus Melainabacteria bacterium]